MKILLLYLLPIFLFGSSVFDTPKYLSLDLSTFNTSMTKEHTDTTKNYKIKCRLICDKKIYKEQRISDAISYYKRSKKY